MAVCMDKLLSTRPIRQVITFQSFQSVLWHQKSKRARIQLQISDNVANRFKDD